MSSNSSVVPLRQPDTVDDPLTAVLRDGARRLLAQVQRDNQGEKARQSG